MRVDSEIQRAVRDGAMSDSRPIGVFDSGLGGLTVAKEIFRQMPGERIIYLGDTARVPYGSKSEEAIRRFAIQDAKVLMDMDIKLLIAACNTVSSVAMEYLEERVGDIPVIGVVKPGARAAVLRSVEKRVGVIGTAATIRSGSYNKAVQNIDPAVKVYGKPCPLFVPLVEEGLIDSEITRLTAEHYLYELIDLGIDCLILGCTHYPILTEIIQSVTGNRIGLVDSAMWTAREAQDILRGLDALAPNDGTGGLMASRFLVSDITPNFETVAETLLGTCLPGIEKVSVEQLEEKQA